MQATALTLPEQRVLGCLIEKRFTTPDQYPLSVNALRLACNQSTNRDPVTAYDEAAVRDAAQLLCRRGLARLASGHTSRAIKYRHLADEALSLEREQLALLAVLLLRGPQTPGELKGRSERMARIESLAEVESLLEGLGERSLVRRLARSPGQKEDRFEHRLGGGDVEAEPAVEEGDARHGAIGPVAEPPRAGAPSGALAASIGDSASRGAVGNALEGTAAGWSAVAERVAALEARVAALQAEVSALRAGDL